MRGLLVALALCAGISSVSASATVNVADYVRKDKFNDIKISPGGDYYAATVPLEDRTILAIFRRSNNTLTGAFRMEKNTHVSMFRWVTPERLLIGIAQKFGELEQPLPTGELFAINADGGKADVLIGYRVDDGGPGTLIKPKKGNDQLTAFPIEAPTVNGKQVLVSVQPYAADPYSTAQLLDVFTGRLAKVASAPVRNASFYVDNKGVVRFAAGSDTDNVRKLFYREGNGAEWELISQDSNGRFEVPLGFSPDDRIAYLRSEQPRGPDAIVALDVATRERKTVMQDDDVDPANVGYTYYNDTNIIYRAGTQAPVGLFFMDGKPRTAFLDEAAPEARLYRSLESAFAGHSVEITSQTADGRLALVKVASDRNPGDFYLFDTVAKKASHLLPRREWLDPELQAQMQPIKMQSRDGMTLHGYLTTPRGSSGKGLPMIVMPHGGPYNIQDIWQFDDEAQMLAAAGYAVLQLNYRGSGGYGRAYTIAGAREWGGKMQDDLTDATNWAIAQGVADRNRICLYGASYGAYASLMGVAKEPGLYRCAAGYVGVYDLPKMQADDARSSARLRNWSEDWVGSRDDLAAVSPNRMADRIKVPVFLAAGGEDEIAPIDHSRMMEQALRKAGVPVETLYYETEGHGFYLEAHQNEFYTRLLAFLSKHLGGAQAASAAAATGTAK